MARHRQLSLFGDGENDFPRVSRRQLAGRVRRALRAYADAVAAPGFALGALAEAQARVLLLRETRRSMATRGRGRDSKVRLAEWIVTPTGARIERLLRAAIQRVEKLEAGLAWRSAAKSVDMSVDAADTSVRATQSE